MSKTYNSPSASVTTSTVVAFKPIPKPDVSHLPLLDVSTLPSTVLMQTLGKALTMRRDHGSYTEAEFVGWLTNRLPVTLIDAAGNIHVDLCTTPQHRTMFTSHTDSVHRGGGVNSVRVDGDFWRADGAALGADDGAGIALMCHMIERGVAGYYVFFRGEECGGIGSKWLAEEMPELLMGFDHAVAFDRAGSSDVITHQGRGRCCSDEFAQALSDALNDQGQLYMPDDTGVYTDTAEFIDTIPECTNLSVFYNKQHSDQEELNVTALVALADALVQIDWSALPVARDPKVRRFAASRYDKWFSDSWPPAMETTRHGSMDGGVTVDYPDEDDLDVAELELHHAIEDAIDGDYSLLHTLMAEYLQPGNADGMRHYVHPSKLDFDELSEAMFSLEQGWTADGILADLVDQCSTI